MTATEFVVPQLWPQQIEQGLARLPRLFGQTPIPQSPVWRLDCDRYSLGQPQSVLEEEDCRVPDRADEVIE